MRQASSLGALAALVLFVAPALAEAPAGSRARGGAAKRPTGATASGLVDKHFLCRLDGSSGGGGATARPVELKPWTSAGIADVPASTKAKFKMLGTVRSQADFQRWLKVCPKLADKVTRFVSPANKGNMSSATLVVAVQDVAVYRAYSNPIIQCGVDRASSTYGSWWSIVPLPAGAQRDTYRRKMAVCASWNDFSQKVTCTLKKGTVIAVGPTQSMDCTADNHAKEGQAGCPAVIAGWKDKHPASGNHQVFLNLFGRDAERANFLTNCHEEVWR